jgi:methylated-DNA-[protein]-cysteine S-methyltransferase
MISLYSPKLRLYIHIEVENSTIKKLRFSKVRGVYSREKTRKETRKDRARKEIMIAKDLKRYLAGEAVDFSNYSISLSTLTNFERAVLLETRKIPFGTTVSYSELANRIGIAAIRAVGNALAKNPVPLIIPCHRVIRKNGSLGGYSAGVDVKQKLLKIEGIKIRG